MKYKLLDLLACPIDKHFSLKLYALSVTVRVERVELRGEKPLANCTAAYTGGPPSRMEALP